MSLPVEILSTISVVLFFYPGLNLGVDFRGGVVVELRGQQALQVEAFAPLGFGELRVQEFGSPQDVLARFGNKANLQNAQRMITSRMAEALPGVQIRRTEVVGARVSSALFRNGLLTAGLALAAVLVYIWFRFEWQCGVSVVATPILDVTKTVRFFAVTQIEFDLNSVAGLLTLIGYSVTDKVVVYDRIRENLGKYRAMPLRQLIDLSINQTLGRTVAMSLTVFLSILPLALISSAVMRLWLGHHIRYRHRHIFVDLYRLADPPISRRKAAAAVPGTRPAADRAYRRSVDPFPAVAASRRKFAQAHRYRCPVRPAHVRMRLNSAASAPSHPGSSKLRHRCSTPLLFCSSSRRCSSSSDFASRSPPI